MIDKKEQLLALLSDFKTDEATFMKKNHLSLSDYRILQEVAKEYKKDGTAKTFASNVVQVFKAYGFSVHLDAYRINYIIE